MLRRSPFPATCALLFALSLPSVLGQVPKKSTILSAPIGSTTAVSFFWFGDEWSHWRQPMNFYVADPGDPRLHTVRIGEGGLHSAGWDAWILAPEMRALIDALAHSDLEWQDSTKIETLKPAFQRKGGDWFEITVISSSGTAKASIRLTRMCDELERFDSVIATPRLLWQFQTLRWDDGCAVPGYDNLARPKE
jgi:hypothetical protein